MMTISETDKTNKQTNKQMESNLRLLGSSPFSFVSGDGVPAGQVCLLHNAGTDHRRTQGNLQLCVPCYCDLIIIRCLCSAENVAQIHENS